MKLFGITLSRDFEEAKSMRREALRDKENIGFLVAYGHMGILGKKYIWRLDGGCFPIYSWYLSPLLYKAVCIIRVRLFNRLFRPV